MNSFLKILSFLTGLYLIYLVLWFFVWYIKMHFHPKWWWAFWMYTLLPFIYGLIVLK